MTKFILPAVGLALGLLAGTAWTVVSYEPPPVTAADSAAVDSAHAAEAEDGAGAHGGAEHVAETGDPAEAEHGADSTSAPGAHEAPGAGGAGAHGAEAAPADRGGAGSAREGDDAAADGGDATRGAAEPAGSDDEGAAQLAQIFAAMQPKDAARVLMQLTDAEIEKVLVRMATRQAAAVLSNLDPDRAAGLSRAVLGRPVGQ